MDRVLLPYISRAITTACYLPLRTPTYLYALPWTTRLPRPRALPFRIVPASRPSFYTLLGPFTAFLPLYADGSTATHAHARAPHARCRAHAAHRAPARIRTLLLYFARTPARTRLHRYGVAASLQQRNTACAHAACSLVRERRVLPRIYTTPTSRFHCLYRLFGYPSDTGSPL